MRSVAPYDRRDIFGSFHLVKSPNKVLMLINEKEVNMLYDDLTSTEGTWLCHHGVKGMRWGVRRERKKYTPVKVPRFSKDPIGYGVAKAKNFAFKDIKDATAGEKALAVALGLGVGAIAAGNIAIGSQVAAQFAAHRVRREALQARGQEIMARAEAIRVEEIRPEAIRVEEIRPEAIRVEGIRLR